MAIPFGYYEGNRAEWMAIGALSKIGFTVPVPRQEDHFGVDFIVHLAKLKDNTVIPSGKSFGIQIKSNTNDIEVNTPANRTCLSNLTIPFFIGVLSREGMTLTIYNTLGRHCFFWMKGDHVDFKIVFQDADLVPDYEGGVVYTGKPIMVVPIADSPKGKTKISERMYLQEGMERWINLENEALSLREQHIPLVFLPQSYDTNKHIKDTNLDCIAYSNIRSLANLCGVMNKMFISYRFYLKDCMNRQEEQVNAANIKREIEELQGLAQNFVKRNSVLFQKLEKVFGEHSNPVS